MAKERGRDVWVRAFYLASPGLPLGTRAARWFSSSAMVEIDPWFSTECIETRKLVSEIK